MAIDIYFGIFVGISSISLACPSASGMAAALASFEKAKARAQAAREKAAKDAKIADAAKAKAAREGKAAAQKGEAEAKKLATDAASGMRALADATFPEHHAKDYRMLKITHPKPKQILSWGAGGSTGLTAINGFALPERHHTDHERASCRLRQQVRSARRTLR